MVLPDIMVNSIFGILANLDINLFTFIEGIASFGFFSNPTSVPS
jgi:hypothetical protein